MKKCKSTSGSNTHVSLQHECMYECKADMHAYPCMFFFFLAEMKESDIIQHFVTRSLRPPSLVCCRGFKQLGRRGCVVIVLKVSL